MDPHPKYTKNNGGPKIPLFLICHYFANYSPKSVYKFPCPFSTPSPYNPLSAFADSGPSGPYSDSLDHSLNPFLAFCGTCVSERKETRSVFVAIDVIVSFFVHFPPKGGEGSERDGENNIEVDTN